MKKLCYKCKNIVKSEGDIDFHCGESHMEYSERHRDYSSVAANCIHDEDNLTDMFCPISEHDITVEKEIRCKEIKELKAVIADLIEQNRNLKIAVDKLSTGK
jgi:hypothetical protein